MSHRRRSMTAQHIKTLLCSIKKKTHPGGKKSILPEKVGYIIPAAENILSRHCQNYQEIIGKTLFMSQCQQFKLQVGSKDRTRIKNPLKTSFRKKGDPFWTPSRKAWNNPPYFFPRKYDHNQISNKVTQQPWKTTVFQMSYLKNESKNSRGGSYLKASFCAAHTAITKCTPLKPNAVSGIPAGRKKNIKNKNKKSKRRLKVRKK